MRRMSLLVAVLLAGGIIGGCSYTPARIDPEPVIEVGDGHRDHDHDHDHGRGGDFCPPGQAKKGRC